MHTDLLLICRKSLTARAISLLAAVVLTCVGLCLPRTASGQATIAQTQPSATASAQVTIPGPLRSFLRMAGISQKVSPEEILPFLARNIVVQGYQDARA